MKKSQFLFIITLIFAIIITVFALTNSNTVEINLFISKFKASQALVIFISAALGGIIATTLGLIKNIKLSSDLKKAKKENESIKKKLQLLEAKVNELSKLEK